MTSNAGSSRPASVRTTVRDDTAGSEFRVAGVAQGNAIALGPIAPKVDLTAAQRSALAA